jgi:hypothetical protein
VLIGKLIDNRSKVIVVAGLPTGFQSCGLKTDQWSRLDSSNMSGNTDHWTKMKVQSMPLRGAQPGDVINGSYYNQSGQARFEKPPGCNCEHTREVTQPLVAAFKDNSSTKMNQLNEGRLTVEAPKSGIKKQWMNNCYQRRAREGFRYWLIYRPPPTKFGKYGIGSYKTVMGMGMAPRT